MKHGYLEPTDPGAFLGIEKKSRESYERSWSESAAECAKCLGHGGWNLRLSPDGQHSKASCDNCNGWGYVPAAQGAHIHDWKYQANLGNCYNRYRCVVPGCGKFWDVDSSD
jgi:hypothetical protein